MRPFLRRYGAAIAFVILALATYTVTTRQAHKGDMREYHTQLTQCVELNKVRDESNARIASHISDTQGLLDTLDVIKRKYEANDPHVVAATTLIKRDVESRVHYEYVPLTNCNTTVQKP